MINEIFSETKAKMLKTLNFFGSEIATIRTGRASTTLVDSLMVDYYGSPTPLKNIANVSTPESQLISIQPFDPTSLEIIEKTILSSDIGIQPNNDGNIIRLNIPPLTKERRLDLVKVLHKKIEEGKIAIRNIRRDSNELVKVAKNDNKLSEDNFKRALDNIQEITDDYIKQFENLSKDKEKEILDS